MINYYYYYYYYCKRTNNLAPTYHCRSFVDPKISRYNLDAKGKLFLP